MNLNFDDSGVFRGKKTLNFHCPGGEMGIPGSAAADQVYVKAEDGKQSVQKYVDQVAKENGAKIQIKGFVRFETGEGIEKKHEDFAAEVAAQRNA